MTQFQPPPETPDVSPSAGRVPSAGPPPGGQGYISPGEFVALRRSTTPPWSAAAIAGFVLSLLGCAGITALAGLILGVVGIFKTRGGQRRGLGLAVAAIPISLVMGCLSILVVTLTIFGVRGKTAVDQLPTVLAADSSATVEAVSALRAIASDEFNAEVNDEALEEWLQDVGAKHGRLVEVLKASRVQPKESPTGARTVNFDGKFVNGPAGIAVTFKRSGWDVKIDDLAVDGVSSRDRK